MRGQVSLEAMLVLAVFIALLSVLLTFQAEQNEKFAQMANGLGAAAKAEKCAVIIDAMASNPGAVLLEGEEECYGKGGTMVFAQSNGIEKQSETTAGKVEKVLKGSEFSVRIENEAHYR